MVVNFKTREISRGTRKLTWTPTLKKKILIIITTKTASLRTCLGTRCKPRSQKIFFFFAKTCLDRFDVLMSKMIFKK